MQGRTAILLASLMLIASPALAEPPKTEAPAPTPKPAVTAEKPVDENGVPAWAKRKRLQPVQSCETRPNIGVETWRQKFDSSAPQRLKPRTPTSTCH